ncbi:ComF family protein [Streptomyces bicolor]|uniref:ComF family protein n=1 Tax=Streptomyces bicolor TaxID=66874 RepID=UPI0004E0C17F|nr:ComF family protein [Streptomyces bicolor]
MRGWWQDLTDLVLPAECGGCGRSRTVLCPECRAVLSGAVPSRVRPVPEPPGLPVVHAVARYTDEVRAALLAHKERGALALAAPLGAALAGAVREALQEAGAGGCGASARGARPGRSGWDARSMGAARVQGAQVRADRVGRSGSAAAPVLLVPVPSARGAVRARGHDPARRIALAAAGELRRAGTPARVLAVLRQRRAVADQSGLNSRQRLDNLAGALTVAPGGGRLLGGGPVVLVDDLMTTGASLAEAARAVRAALAEGGSVYGRTFAEVDAYGWVTEQFGACGDGTTAVYATGSRESTGERRTGSTEGVVRRAREMPGIMGGGRVGDLICAAVVAATPDSFEINRN